MCAYMKLCFNRKYPGLFRIQSHTFFGNMTWKVKPLTTEPNSHWGICQKVISYKKIDVHPPIKKCILGFFITRKLCNFKIHAKLLLVFLLTCLITFFHVMCGTLYGDERLVFFIGEVRKTFSLTCKRHPHTFFVWSCFRNQTHWRKKRVQSL